MADLDQLREPQAGSLGRQMSDAELAALSSDQRGQLDALRKSARDLYNNNEQRNDGQNR